MTRKSPRAAASAALLTIALLSTLAVRAQGIYAPVQLKDKEYQSLIDTSRQLSGYFEQRSLLFTEPRVAELVASVGRGLAPALRRGSLTGYEAVMADPAGKIGEMAGLTLRDLPPASATTRAKPENDKDVVSDVESLLKK